MHKIPLFSPLAEGMMAALASRTYDWRYWEIEENFEISPKGLSKLVTHLRTLPSNGNPCEVQAEKSSFAAVDEIFRGLGRPAQLKAANSDWQQSSPALGEFFAENGAASDFKSLLGNEPLLHISRIKNSLGFAKDSII